MVKKPKMKILLEVILILLAFKIFEPSIAYSYTTAYADTIAKRQPAVVGAKRCDRASQDTKNHVLLMCENPQFRYKKVPKNAVKSTGISGLTSSKSGKETPRKQISDTSRPTDCPTAPEMLQISRKRPRGGKQAQQHANSHSLMRHAVSSVAANVSTATPTSAPTFDWPPKEPARAGLPFGDGWRALYLDKQVATCS